MYSGSCFGFCMASMIKNLGKSWCSLSRKRLTSFFLDLRKEFPEVDRITSGSSSRYKPTFVKLMFS